MKLLVHNTMRKVVTGIVIVAQEPVHDFVIMVTEDLLLLAAAMAVKIGE